MHVDSDSLFGIAIEYDARPANLLEIKSLMTDFMMAYFKRDKDGLSKVLAPDFEWHLHKGGLAPVGQTKFGVAGMIEELAKRSERWSEVTYSNVQINCTESLITQTFHVKGHDSISGAFEANGVDLYRISNGKLLSKDSYWKDIEESEEL